MADQLLLARQFDDNGDPGAGYVASFFLSGTTTPETVFTDSACTIPAGTTVTADAAGRFAQTFHPGGVALKCVITDADEGTVETLDPVPALSVAAGAAEDISFIPTVDLPFDNVQDAVEGSVAAAASGFAAFGLGITGNAPLLANIDATNIGSGQYRFDATTTGTFPTGSAAANTGIIETWRETSGSAVMFLYDDTQNVRWERRMASSTWGAWRQPIVVTQGAAAAAITTIETTLTNNDAALPTSGAVFDLVPGVNQYWQNLTASRSAGVTYQNTSGKQIEVSVISGVSTGTASLAVGLTAGTLQTISLTTTGGATAVAQTNAASVENGHYYQYTGSITAWMEKRA